MLDVNIEKILPITEVRDSLNQIVDEVGGSDELYVITKNGRPTAVVVGVHHLEKLTGVDSASIMPDDEIYDAEDEAADDDVAELTPEEKAAESLRLRDKVLQEAMAMDDDEDINAPTTSDGQDALMPDTETAKDEVPNNVDDFAPISTPIEVPIEEPAASPAAPIEQFSFSPSADMTNTTDDFNTTPAPISPNNDLGIMETTADSGEAPLAAPAPAETPNIDSIYPAAPNLADDDQFEILSTTPAPTADQNDQGNSVIEPPQSQPAPVDPFANPVDLSGFVPQPVTPPAQPAQQPVNNVAQQVYPQQQDQQQ